MSKIDAFYRVAIPDRQTHRDDNGTIIVNTVLHRVHKLNIGDMRSISLESHLSLIGFTGHEDVIEVNLPLDDSHVFVEGDIVLLVGSGELYPRSRPIIIPTFYGNGGSVNQHRVYQG